MCNYAQNHRVVTPCFDCLAKTSPCCESFKYLLKTIKNLSRYLGLCVIMLKT